MTLPLPSLQPPLGRAPRAVTLHAWTALGGWALTILGLLVIAANPGVPSLGYALFWLAVMTVGRSIAIAIPWAAVAIDLALLLACCIGLELGGLILVPALLTFALADALGGRDRTPTTTSPGMPR